MATRKHAKHASTPAAPRTTSTDATATDTPAATAGATTNRPPRNNRTNAEVAASRSDHSIRATTSRQRFADADPTTSSGKKPNESDNTEITKVVVITTKSEFDKKLEEAGNKLVLIEFFASWCGPCRLLSPKLEQLANDYEDKVFVMKMDVDECEEVPMEYGVSSMPTFLFMRNKQKIELFVGSNSEKLIKRLEKLCDPTKGVISPAPSTTSEKPADPASKDLKSSPSKKKLGKSKKDAPEQDTAATSSTGKKTAAK